MFERYNIKDLFLALIHVNCPNSDYEVYSNGLRGKTTEYGYFTVVVKIGEEYIDLQTFNHVFEKGHFVNPNEECRIIEYLEPLSYYYTQERVRKGPINREEALEKLKDHSNDVHKKCYTIIREHTRFLV